MSSNIIVPLPKKYDTPSEKVKKPSGPLPHKSDAPSENIKKQVRIWMISKRRWSLLLKGLTMKVLLTRLTKKGGKNLMWWRNRSILPFQQKIILIHSIKHRNHKRLKNSSYLQKK